MLFLDDVREPNWVYPSSDNRMILVKNYDQFVDWITRNGLPDIISFDHDLADEHYHENIYAGAEEYSKLYTTFKEKTGYHCAKWLIDYCLDNKVDLPEFYCHSANPAGKENIISLLTNFEKFIKNSG